MVKATASAILFAVAALNVASTSAIPVSYGVAERDITDSTEINARAEFNDVYPRAPTGTGVKTPTTKKTAAQKKKAAVKKTVAAKKTVNEDKLLGQEFSLEQSRIALEKQEQGWKPTTLRREEEAELFERAPPAPGTPKPKKTAAQKKKAAVRKTVAAKKTVNEDKLLGQEFSLEQSRIGLEKQEQAWKPTTLRRDEDFSELLERDDEFELFERAPPAPVTPKPKKTAAQRKKAAVMKTVAAKKTVNEDKLLGQEFSLEQSRIGLEKQEQAWKPTTLRREEEVELFERAPPAPGTPKPKKTAAQKKKAAVRKTVAAKKTVNEDKLLGQEFSLEQSRIGLEKQEQAWKPTTLRREEDAELFERDDEYELFERAPPAPGTPKPKKTAAQKKKAAVRKTVAAKKTVNEDKLLGQEFSLEQSRIGLEKQEQAWKPTTLRREEDADLFERDDEFELFERAPPAPSTPKPKKTAAQRKKAAVKKTVAAKKTVNEDKLLGQEFSLEQSRIGLEKQEQAWKPTTLRRDEDFSELLERDDEFELFERAPPAPGTPKPKKTAAQKKKAAVRKTVAAKKTVNEDKLLGQEFSLEQSRIGLEKQEQAWKPTTLRREEDAELFERDDEYELFERAPPAPVTPKPKKTAAQKKKAAVRKTVAAKKTVNEDKLLGQEFSLEQSRIGLEKQEQAWKPTTLRRDEDFAVFERAPPVTKPAAKPKSSKKTTTKKQMPADFYTKQYTAEEAKVKKLSDGLKQKAPAGTSLKTQYATEQSRVKAISDEMKWKPTEWSG